MVKITRHAAKTSRRTVVIQGDVQAIGSNADGCGLTVRGEDGLDYVLFLDNDTIRRVTEYAARKQ